MTIPFDKSKESFLVFEAEKNIHYFRGGIKMKRFFSFCLLLISLAVPAQVLCEETDLEQLTVEKIVEQACLVSN